MHASVVAHLTAPKTDNNVCQHRSGRPSALIAAHPPRHDHVVVLRAELTVGTRPVIALLPARRLSHAAQRAAQTSARRRRLRAAATAAAASRNATAIAWRAVGAMGRRRDGAACAT